MSPTFLGAEGITSRLSDGKFDFLTWDPRDVGVSLPAPRCLPDEAVRDRWSFTTPQYLATLESPRAVSLAVTDAYKEAVWRTFWEKRGDIGRFLGTACVARDIDQIRIALGQDEVTGDFASYESGIAQTYTALFPDRVGRMLPDGTEFIRDHRTRDGFAITGLDNATDAWRDGFLGECVKAGPGHCALAKPKDGKPVTLPSLLGRMEVLLSSLAARPIPVYRADTGPVLYTYTHLVDLILQTLYGPMQWSIVAEIISKFETDGNPRPSLVAMSDAGWVYAPRRGCPTHVANSDDELAPFVICADSYDATEPNDMTCWQSLWSNMTAKSWVSGDVRICEQFRCRHFTKFWPRPAEVFRGNLSQPLRNPVLLIAETYDPATPLRNGKRLAQEMGPSNARLVVHRGYGHGSQSHPSNYTDAIAKAYILHGRVPELETNCYTSGNPYVRGAPVLERRSQSPTDLQGMTDFFQESSAVF